ncbi:MAG: hypothetical protein K2G27_01430 [Duncaniella sp.]|nr:hypothetical protein [Bacteroides sp.]MDE6065463.1 hypothetical protein [Duncaniella sp.]
MNKAIYIGELTLHISLRRDGQASTHIGDRMVDAAMLDAAMGVQTLFVGETAADTIGDHIISSLRNANVDITSVDRYTEGAGAVRIAPADKEDNPSRPVMHAAYPAEPVNPIWPRIDEGDVMVYGSYMAIDKRNHSRVIELVNYARSRKAETVYLPYFDQARVTRITRVMPEVWESLEAATLVIATTEDLSTLFPGETPADAYNAHINFYCPRCLVIDPKALSMQFFDGKNSWTLHCHPTDDTEEQWTAGAIAGAIRALTEGITDPDDIMAKANETAHSRLSKF